MSRLGRGQPFKPKITKLRPNQSFSVPLTETVVIASSMSKTIGRSLTESIKVLLGARIAITIQHSKVAASLTGYPIYVDMSGLPADFFAQVNTDGSNIRMYTSDGVTEVPFELCYIDTTLKTGALYFKGDISSVTDTVFYIDYGDPTRAAYAANATYGKYNVWSSYSDVYHLKGSSANDSATAQKNGTVLEILPGAEEYNFIGESVIANSQTGSSTMAFGKVTTFQKVAQSFTITATTLARLETFIKRVASTGTYAGTVTLAIQADTAGSPSGSNLTSTTISAANWNALSTSADICPWTSTLTSLALATTYWLVISSSTTDDANYANVTYDNAGAYGVLKTYDGAAWNTQTGSLRMNICKSGYIDLGAQILMTYNDFSVGFFLKKTTTPYENIISNAINGSLGQFEINKTAGRLRFESKTNGVFQIENLPLGGITTTDGVYHQYRVVSNASNFLVYCDGVLTFTNTANTDAVDQQYRYFGPVQNRVNANYGLALNGYMKEVKFSAATGIDADYVLTEYNNISSPSTFYTIGAPEHPAGFVKTLARPLAEVITIVDTLSAKIIARMFSETIVLVDTLTKTISRFLTETVTLVDSLTSLRVVNIIITEVVTIVDTLSKAVSRGLSEVVTLVATLGKGTGRFFTEVVTIVARVGSIFFQSLTETITVTDSFLRTISKVFTENIVITVTLSLFKRARGIITGLNKDTNTKVGTRKGVLLGKNADTNTKIGTRLE